MAQNCVDAQENMMGAGKLHAMTVDATKPRLMLQNPGISSCGWGCCKYIKIQVNRLQSRNLPKFSFWGFTSKEAVPQLPQRLDLLQLL